MYNEIQDKNNKFYNKDWFMWLTLILFPPVGIYLLYKHKKYDKPARIALSIIFVFFFIIFAPIREKESEQTNNANKTETVDVKTESKKPKEDNIIVNSDLSIIKEMKKDNDKIIVDTIDDSIETDKNKQFITFRMTMLDVIKQLKNKNEEYKILEINRYKDDKKIFTIIFNKNNIDKIKDDDNFMTVTNYAEKIDGYKIEEEKETEKTKRYFKNKELYANLLEEEFKSFSIAAKNGNYDNVRIHCENIVFYAKEFKKNDAPAKYKKTDEKIKKACDIYIDIYGKLVDKALAGENEWMDNALTRLEEANKLIQEATNDFNNK